jgi:DDE_Tnp_1-associated
VPSLRAIVAQVPDPRARRGRHHPWTALVLLVIVGLLCGANTQHALARWGQTTGWARLRRLGFMRGGGPSQPTLHRLLRDVDVDQLEAVLGVWLQQVRTAWDRQADTHLEGIAIDSKTLRGARRLGASDAHLVSAFCQRRGLLLGQVAVPDPTNELGAISPLLARLALADETVTFDALFTQTTVARQGVQQGGAYLMVVKGNQRGLLDGVVAATAPRPARPVRRLGRARSVRLAHGRFEERTLEATRAPADLGLAACPPGAAAAPPLRQQAHRRGAARRDRLCRHLAQPGPGLSRPVAALMAGPLAHREPIASGTRCGLR